MRIRGPLVTLGAVGAPGAGLRLGNVAPEQAPPPAPAAQASAAPVADGTINGPCHGSKFNLDGTVANGPATKPLAAKPVRVEADSIAPG